MFFSTLLVAPQELHHFVCLSTVAWFASITFELLSWVSSAPYPCFFVVLLSELTDLILYQIFQHQGFVLISVNLCVHTQVLIYIIQVRWSFYLKTLWEMIFAPQTKKFFSKVHKPLDSSDRTPYFWNQELTSTWQFIPKAKLSVGLIG